MSNVITVEFDPTVKDKLAVLPEKMADYAYEALMDAAHLIVGLAQIYCPVETGALRDSIRVERGGVGLRWREVKVRAGGYVTNPKTGKLVNYAIYQEGGTRFMVGQHFLGKAVEDVKPQLLQMLEAGVVEKVKTTL